MHWASLERSLIAALSVLSVSCGVAAFQGRRIEMGSVADADAAGQSYADAGPCRIASRRNIRLQGSTPAQGNTRKNSPVGHNFTIHLSVTRPISGGDVARKAPFPVVLFLNGFQVCMIRYVILPM